jgi:hypothetical protein
LNNTSQAIQSILVGVGGVNLWDNGVEGNYWSDYHGHDFDKNGIGDTPYIIDEIAESHPQDRYPLMTPYHSNHQSLTDYAIAITAIVGGTLLIGTFLIVRIKKSTTKSE